jgi:hypothetical protein
MDGFGYLILQLFARDGGRYFIFHPGAVWLWIDPDITLWSCLAINRNG